MFSKSLGLFHRYIRFHTDFLNVKKYVPNRHDKNKFKNKFNDNIPCNRYKRFELATPKKESIDLLKEP